MNDNGPSSPPPPWGFAGSGRWAWCFDLSSALVVAVVIAIGLMTFEDYGITWDETWHMVYGDHILSWFLTLGADTSALSYRLDYMYGGAFDLLGAITRRLSPLPEYDTIHLTGAAIGWLGLLGTWSLARRLGGPVAGFGAVVLLATTPVYYGHMFSNPKDLPFAVGYVWAMDALIEAVLSMPQVSRRALARFALVAGLAMGVRIAGLLLLVYWVASVVALAVLRARGTGSLDAGIQTLRRFGPSTAFTVLGAWLVMLSTWPWALLDPLRRPLMALGRMSRFTIHRRSMPFAGESMMTTEPRWDYLLHYFGFKIPLSVLLLTLVAIGLSAAVVMRRSAWRALPRAQRNAGLVLAAGMIAPPAYAIVVRSVVYDGLRHFLFLVPLLAVVAGLMLTVIPAKVTRAPRATALAVALVVGGLVTRQIQAMRQLHPYQYIYFNELIGGVPGALGNYDTDYYGSSYKEGFRALAEYLWTHERDQFLSTRYFVSGCIPGMIAVNYIHGNFAWVEKPEDRSDFYLGYTRADCHLRRSSHPELFRITRMDTLLLMVRDLRPSEPEPTPDPGPQRATVRPQKPAPLSPTPTQPSTTSHE